SARLAPLPPTVGVSLRPSESNQAISSSEYATGAAATCESMHLPKQGMCLERAAHESNSESIVSPRVSCRRGSKTCAVGAGIAAARRVGAKIALYAGSPDSRTLGVVGAWLPMSLVPPMP